MFNLVKTISTELDTLQRRLIKVLRFGKSDVQTPFSITPFGVDANPITGMIAVYAPTEEKGKSVIIGYINKNQIALPGEHRIFSTNDEGDEETFIHLKNDGIMEMGGASDFMVRYLELESGFNQLKDDFNDLVNKYNSHVHPGVSPGGGSTSPTATTGSTSNADISAAKIEEIKTL